MAPVSDESSVFGFRIWTRAQDSARWTPGSRLLVCVDDGGGQVQAELSWATQDGTQWSIGFSPDMASLYGYRRATDGAVAEVRGELAERQDQLAGLSVIYDSARVYEFDTQAEGADADAGTWKSVGRLRVLVDDGGETPARWLAWRDQSGDAYSVAMCSASPTDNADVTYLVASVRASAEHRSAGEVAANLVEASTRKWFAPHNHATLEFRLAEPVQVDRYVLTSANDAPDRDPGVWTLRGSANGRRWRTLDTRTGQSFAGRHQSETYWIAEPGLYDRYRLEISGSNGSPHLQLESVRFLVDGSGRFVGYRRRAGQAPVAYRGMRVAPVSPETPTEPQPKVASVSLPSPSPSPRPRGGRGAEWNGWASGGSWLPLGGTLAHESLTSPSGRFTALHSMYDLSLAVWDNLTRKQVWASDVPHSSVLCLGPDGDLAAWDHRGSRVWSAGTAWRGVRRLELRDSGELALIDANGAVVWSSGIPEPPVAAGAAAAGPRTVARGSTMRRGESLYRQTLTSADGSTVLYHDGRIARLIVRGETSHWERSYNEQQAVLVLDEDGYLHARTPDGAVLEQIAGPGAELSVVRGRAELHDEAGNVVWASRSE